MERIDEVLFEGSRAVVQRYGVGLGARAHPGDVVALVGPLGAGKTFLAQSIARGVGVPASTRVTSPTFTVMQEYPARIGLFHADLYRLAHPDELHEIGLFERGSEGLVVVEWADRMPEVIPSGALWITLSAPTATTRRGLGRGDGPAALRLARE